MGKLSYNDKLHMQMLREQGLDEKAIISSCTLTKGESSESLPSRRPHWLSCSA